MEIGSLLALCLLGAMLCILLSAYRPEYAMAAVVAIGTLVFLTLLRRISPSLSALFSLCSRVGVDGGYMKTAFKALGVCYVTQFAADVCRDFGQGALAAKAELAGKCAVFLLSVPLLESIIEIALSLIGEV